MDCENAIEVNDIHKAFKVYLDKGQTLKEKVLFQNRRKYEMRTVLNGISFNVKKGEAIGLIGQNGCGKSTTLKLLTRIMYPDSGTITMNGRVASLIELGAGFHPDMSGRENIYINAAIFGLTRKEIDERLESIIAFSELEEFIDNPVRTYSSGMYMRLAFSVAISVDADILLIDEILAVGDASFQAKCFNKLREIKAAGTTIVIVSHSLGQIEQICDRSIWIQDGKIRAEGIPREVHLMYSDYMGRKSGTPLQPVRTEPESTPAHETEPETAVEEKPNETKEEQGAELAGEPAAEPVEEQSAVMPEEEPEPAPKIDRWGNGKARITNIKSYNDNDEETTSFKTGESIRFVLDYTVNEEVEDAVIGIGIFRNDGVQCYGTNTRLDKMDTYSLTKDGTAELIISPDMLLPGEYNLDFAIESGYGIPVDYFTKAYTITTYSEYDDVGVCRLKHEWKLDV